MAVTTETRSALETMVHFTDLSAEIADIDLSRRHIAAKEGDYKATRLAFAQSLDDPNTLGLDDIRRFSWMYGLAYEIHTEGLDHGSAQRVATNLETRLLDIEERVAPGGLALIVALSRQQFPGAAEAYRIMPNQKLQMTQGTVEWRTLGSDFRRPEKYPRLILPAEPLGTGHAGRDSNGPEVLTMRTLQERPNLQEFDLDPDVEYARFLLGEEEITAYLTTQSGRQRLRHVGHLLQTSEFGFLRDEVLNDEVIDALTLVVAETVCGNALAKLVDGIYGNFDFQDKIVLKALAQERGVRGMMSAAQRAMKDKLGNMPRNLRYAVGNILEEAAASE